MKKQLFLALMLFSLCVPGLFGQEKATEPVERNITRHHKQAGWINSVARNEKNFPIDLIFVGDSITHGWEGAGKDVWQQYYGNRLALNFGISGDRTGHVIWRLENAPMDKILPKMAVVMIGTNNRTAPKETADGIKKIVAMLQERYPEIKVLLLEVFPRGEKSDDPSRIRINAINDELRTICADMKNVEIKSLADIFLEKDGTLPKSIMPDFLHPNAEGYKRWANAIEPEIEKVLGPIPADPPEARGVAREMARFNLKNEILKKGNVDVLMIGDSITHGWEGNGADVWSKLFKNVKAVNLGTGWDRTENVVWRLEHYDFSKAKPKAAFLLIGVNNSGTSTPENIAKGNRKICQILHEKFPEMKIYVQKVFPWGSADAEGKNDLRDQINLQIAKSLADLSYVEVLDLSKCFLDKDNKLNQNIMTPDKVHLLKPGYEKWQEAIQPYVEAL